MYGDQVPPSTSSCQHADSEPLHTINQEDTPGQPQNSHTAHKRKKLVQTETNFTGQQPDRHLVHTRILFVRILTSGNRSPHTQTPQPPAQAAQPPQC